MRIYQESNHTSNQVQRNESLPIYQKRNRTWKVGLEKTHVCISIKPNVTRKKDGMTKGWTRQHSTYQKSNVTPKNRRNNGRTDAPVCIQQQSNDTCQEEQSARPLTIHKTYNLTDNHRSRVGQYGTCQAANITWKKGPQDQETNI